MYGSRSAGLVEVSFGVEDEGDWEVLRCGPFGEDLAGGTDAISCGLMYIPSGLRGEVSPPLVAE